MGLLDNINTDYKIDLIEKFKSMNYKLDYLTDNQIWFTNIYNNTKIQIFLNMNHVACVLYDNQKNKLDEPIYPVANDKIFHFDIVKDWIIYILKQKGIVKENIVKKETVITKVEPIKFEKGTYQDFINTINNINKNIEKQTEILNKQLEEVQSLFKNIQ